MKKLFSIHLLGISILLLIMVFAVGCISVKTTPGSSTPGLLTVVVTPLDQTNPTYVSANEKCPVPTLIFNNSQEITKLHTGLLIGEPEKYSTTNGYPIPLGSVIYHSSGFITRIFDSTGKQILIVNDSESYVKVDDMGNEAATTYFTYFPENVTSVVNPRRDFQYYINESDQVNPCVLTVVFNGWSNPFYPLTPRR